MKRSATPLPSGSRWIEDDSAKLRHAQIYLTSSWKIAGHVIGAMIRGASLSPRATPPRVTEPKHRRTPCPTGSSAAKPLARKRAAPVPMISEFARSTRHEHVSTPRASSRATVRLTSVPRHSIDLVGDARFRRGVFFSAARRRDWGASRPLPLDHLLKRHPGRGLEPTPSTRSSRPRLSAIAASPRKSGTSPTSRPETDRARLSIRTRAYGTRACRAIAGRLSVSLAGSHTRPAARNQLHAARDPAPRPYTTSNVEGETVWLIVSTSFGPKGFWPPWRRSWRTAIRCPW